MAAEILRPQDFLAHRIGVSTCRRNHYSYNYSHNQYYSNARPNRKPAARSERTEQRKRQPEPPAQANRRSSFSDDSKISRNHHNNHHGSRGARENLVMEKVSILRRGESLDSKMKSMEMAARNDRVGYMVVTGVDRLGPDPEMVPKQTRIADFRSPVAVRSDMYAGSGFAVSPAPSSLPLPSFSKRKQLTVDDSATRDLRRLLRLDF